MVKTFFQLLEKGVILLIYWPLYLIVYKSNFWRIYDSYHRKPNKWKKMVWNRYMERHAASISIDAFFKGPLILPHGVSGIFITQSAIIGENVVVFQQVTIGANTLPHSRTKGAPTIGDNVYIGAGAKIIGNAKVNNNVRIGANAVVVKDVDQNSTVFSSGMTIIKHSELLDNTFVPYL